MRKYLAAALLVGAVSPAMVTGATLSGTKTRLESALLSAIGEAKRCGVDVDNVDVKVSLKDEVYKVEFVALGKRGGGAEVVVLRATGRVQTGTCLQ